MSNLMILFTYGMVGTIFADDYAGIFTAGKFRNHQLCRKCTVFLGLIDKLANGLANLFNVLFRILYPYLFILIPFGVLFSLRPIDQKLKNIKANWIMIIVTISILIIPFAVVDERRYLFSSVSIFDHSINHSYSKSNKLWP